MTSSASKPATSKIGRSNASTTSFASPICGRRSSGIFARVALYAANATWRNVGPGLSNATATYWGAISSKTLRSIVVKPYTAFVGWPSLVVKYGSA